MHLDKNTEQPKIRTRNIGLKSERSFVLNNIFFLKVPALHLYLFSFSCLYLQLFYRVKFPVQAHICVGVVVYAQAGHKLMESLSLLVHALPISIPNRPTIVNKQAQTNIFNHSREEMGTRR